MRARSFVVAGTGLALGAALGWLVSRLAGSDNVPFFVTFGALAGLGAGLGWTGGQRRRVIAALVMLAIALLTALFTPPPAPIEYPARPQPAATALPTPRADGLTAGEAATLASLQKVDAYPLYSMRYQGGRPGSRPAARSRLVPPRPVCDGRLDAGCRGPLPPGERTPNPAFACSLFAALGDPHDRLFGRNFDWRYSPGLLLFTDRPETGGYASVSMVDLAYLGLGDAIQDLTALPLAERRPLLDAPDWPFDGMNEAGVAVAMAAVPQADERHDPGKPALDSLAVMREVLDRAGNVDEAVAILKQYNIAWGGGPPLHYLVADRAGRAALVEFYGGEIAVLTNAEPWQAATNFTRSAVAGDAAGQCPRYDTLIRRLTEAGGALGPGAALGLLQAVAQTGSATQWSVVYGLDTGRVDIVVGRRYDQVHTFQVGVR